MGAGSPCSRYCPSTLRHITPLLLHRQSFSTGNRDAFRGFFQKAIATVRCVNQSYNSVILITPQMWEISSEVIRKIQLVKRLPRCLEIWLPSRMEFPNRDEQEQRLLRSDRRAPKLQSHLGDRAILLTGIAGTA